MFGVSFEYQNEFACFSKILGWFENLNQLPTFARFFVESALYVWKTFGEDAMTKFEINCFVFFH